MLDSMRNAAKSWVAKVLIGILAISFGVFWGIQDVFQGYRSDALASVGDEEITVQQFQQQFQQVLQNYSRQTGQAITPELARQIGLDRQVLGDLMRDAALDAQARRMKLAVSDAQLAQEIAKEPMFHGGDGKFDPELFRDILRRNNLTEAAYLAGERQRFLRDAVADVATADQKVPPVLVEAVYRHRNEQRDARYFVVAAQEAEIPPPSEEEIKAHYEENQQAYTAPEYRSVVVMRAEPGDLAAKIVLSDADLQAGYERFKADYFTPEKRLIQQITFPTLDEARQAKERIAGGADFLDIAKERGLDEAAVTLGEKARTEIPDAKIADAAFSLAAGQVSDPVEGRLAIALLRVTKITPEHQKTLEEVKAEVGERLKLERAREQLTDTYNAVEDARAAQTSFEDIASKGGLPLVTVPAVDSSGLDKDGKPVDLPFKDEVLRAAFASDVGVENDALTPGDAYVWYEVREVTPAALRPLNQVKDRVRADLMAKRIRALALDKAQKLVERGRQGETLDALAKEVGAEVKTVQGLKRNEISESFDGLATSAIFSVPEQGFAFAPEPDGKGAKVMQSQAVLILPFDAASGDAKAIEDSLARAMGDDLTSSYLTALQNDLGWSIDEALWSRISGTATP